MMGSVPDADGSPRGHAGMAWRRQPSIVGHGVRSGAGPGPMGPRRPARGRCTAAWRRQPSIAGPRALHGCQVGYQWASEASEAQ
jgi:hypothetical protein